MGNIHSGVLLTPGMSTPKTQAQGLKPQTPMRIQFCNAEPYNLEASDMCWKPCEGSGTFQGERSPGPAYAALFPNQKAVTPVSLGMKDSCNHIIAFFALTGPWGHCLRTLSSFIHSLVSHVSPGTCSMLVPPRLRDLVLGKAGRDPCPRTVTSQNL